MNAGRAGKTVRSIENACLSALEVCVHDEALYKSMFTFTFTLTTYLSIVFTAQHIIISSSIIKLTIKLLTNSPGIY